MLKTNKLNVINHREIKNKITIDLFSLNFDKGLTILLCDCYFFLKETKGRVTKDDFLVELSTRIDIENNRNRITVYKDLMSSLLSLEINIINTVSQELYTIVNYLEV